MPPHLLNLYPKPTRGNQIIRRYPVYSYRHKISANGWFDTASCNLAVTRTEAEMWLDQYLGNRVAFYVDNPAEPIWEGLVNRISFQVGGVTFTASLDKLMNRVQVTHSTAAGSATTTTAAANNTDSQAVYGIKQGVIDANAQYTGSGSGLPAALRGFILGTAAWPRTSTAVSGGGGAILLSLEFIGFFHTLEWEIYSSTTFTAASASTIVGEVIAGLANGTTFFNNADSSRIATNAAFNQVRASRNGQTAWQFLQGIQEAGDASAMPWVMGITPTDFNSGQRLFYYQAANTAIEYTGRLSEGMRVRNRYGGIVSPWRAVPDRSIRLNDFLTGWSGLGDDPREGYLETIEYDADSQQIAWQTSDNIELEGAMQFNRYFKAHNTRFGAPVRQIG